jgi:hypothetical protein
MDITNQEEANKAISNKIEEAYKLLKECEEIADKFECEFQFSVTYGAGATYIPKPKEGSEFWKESLSEDDYGWQSSSGSC